MHYNEIAVIFCGTACILFHNRNRLRLTNRVLLFNLRLSAKYQKIKVDNACWHSWRKETREEPMLKSHATMSPLFPTTSSNQKMLVEILDC